MERGLVPYLGLVLIHHHIASMSAERACHEEAVVGWRWRPWVGDRGLGWETVGWKTVVG